MSISLKLKRTKWRQAHAGNQKSNTSKSAYPLEPPAPVVPGMAKCQADEASYRDRGTKERWSLLGCYVS